MRQKGIVASWDFRKVKATDLEKATEELITKTKAAYEKIEALKEGDISFENTIQALLNIEVEFTNAMYPISLPMDVAIDKSLREASVAADKKLSAFSVEMSMKKGVFDNVCSFKEKFGLDGLSPEIARFVNKKISDGRRNGLHLDEATREEVKALKTRISDLGTTFTSNLNEENTILEFSVEELAGVPQDLVDSFEKTEDGKCKVTLKYPHFFPVTRKCRIPATRRKIETAYQSRCHKENTEILEELVKLRHQLSTLLGYVNHAEYIQEVRMAENPQNVSKFLTGLAEKLQTLREQEEQELRKLKKDEEDAARLALSAEEAEKQGFTAQGSVEEDILFWDMRYYLNQIEEKKYSVDKELLKEYFPARTVIDGALKIYQQLLGLKFVECCDDVDKWHDEVQLFRVDDAESGDSLGYFYLDLYPREGKYGHACASPLQPGCITPDGSRQLAVCLMIANFSKPTETKPALFDHDEVETFFHEFGHVMHFICARADTARFAGYNVERDFVEAPSQMLENWCWDEESLKMMSGHYKDGSAIPKDLLNNLLASRKANAGFNNLRQIALASFDQAIHTKASADVSQEFSKAYKYLLNVNTIEGTCMPASFGHMVGYDAQYYGYMWSEVYSFDMFETRFKKEGLLNPKVGLDYRNMILKTGGSKDAIVMLRDFLGREPSNEAFLRSKGIF